MTTLALLAAAALALAVLLLFPVGRQVLRSCYTLDPALVTLAPGLRSAAGMFLVLFTAHATGYREVAIPLALGVLLTNLADFSEPCGERFRAMMLTAVVTALAVLLGGLVAGYSGLHLVAALVVAALVGFAGAIGPRAALVALFGLALFSLYSANAVSVGTAFFNAGWYLVGGIGSALFACATWPLASLYPTRRKLAVGFRQLAAACRAGSGRGDLRVVNALQAATASVANSQASSAARHWLETLLDDLEACRILVLTLNAARQPVVATGLETATTKAAERVTLEQSEQGNPLEQVLTAAGSLSLEVERSLSWRHDEARLQTALGRLEVACGVCTAPIARRHAALLLERFRKITALLNSGRPIGRTGWPAYTGLVALFGLAGVREHLQFRDIHVRHAVKLAVTYTVGTALALGPLNLLLDHHGFWIPLTVAWVCKPDVAGSISRFSMRLCGTVFGVLLSALLLYFITDPVLVILLTALAAFVMSATLFANYSLTVVAATAWVLCLSATAGTYTEELADSRLIATLLGCGLVLVSAYILPVRSGTAAPGQLAAMAARLREALASACAPRHPESTAVPSLRSPLHGAVQRHRLAAVAAIAAAEAEPRAPWEPKAVGVALRELSSVLQGLEQVDGQLSLAVLLNAGAAITDTTRRELEQQLILLEQRLVNATLASSATPG